MNDSNRDPIPVVVSAESIEEGPEAIVLSNAAVVAALVAELLLPDEIAPNALRGASVAYFRDQREAGGFALFAYGSGLDPELVERIRSGLEAMDAPVQSARFERSLAAFFRLSDAERDEFLSGDFFGGDEIRDVLNATDDSCHGWSGELEDLTERTAAWLLSLPELCVLPATELEAFVSSRVALVPDLDDRHRAAEAEAEANMPGFERAIRALCDEVGARFLAITLGDPVHPFRGEETLGWHFLSDRGHHVMVESGDEAVLLDPERGVELARVPLSHPR